MEWRKIPPCKPLATSYDESGDRDAYSREAGDTSGKFNYEPVRRSYLDENLGSEKEPIGQPRRRRRISEVQGVGSYTERSSQENYSGPHRESDRKSSRPIRQNREYYGNSYYDADRSKSYQNERSDHAVQRTYYKEQYNQVREQKRQHQQKAGLDGRNLEAGRSFNPRNKSQENYQRVPKESRNLGNKPYKKSIENRPPVYDQTPIDIANEVRLNKFLSNAGVCSRREADELIKVGAVLVNGTPVTELGTKITAQDKVEVNGREVRPENKVYILLNKPRNCVTTTDDPQERLTVTNIVRNACKERIYPVGRLDRNTTGVLLLTNDGDLAAKLVHPTFKKKKIYHVWLDKEVSAEDMQKIADGVELEDGEMHADAISYVTEDDLSQVGIEIHSGRNRIVRRIFEHLGYHVRKLDRVYFAGLTKKNLGRGKWRYLTQDEVNALKMGAFE